MNKISYQLSVIAFYLSKFNLEAVHELGYKTWREAFEKISEIMGRPNNYLKLRRDEFDALIDNGRKGWKNRAPVNDVKKICDELNPLEYVDLTVKVKAILEDAAKNLRQSITDSRNDGEYISRVNHVIRAQSGKKKFSRPSRGSKK